jgi:hypothetical protein
LPIAHGVADNAVAISDLPAVTFFNAAIQLAMTVIYQSKGRNENRNLIVQILGLYTP